ncbi:MAG: hypothetical protein LN417_08640 [Candidatus Thermoplasmatota archaeon]|nr:hypothetical protein [Candidatus Thermoplasmatota archaeon]
MPETDAGEVAEILEVVSEKIPALLNSLTDVLYGKDQAMKYAQAVAGFYKALKESGMTDDQAFALTETYMSNLNLAGMIGDAMGGKKKMQFKVGDESDIGSEIEAEIKKKIKKESEHE